MLPLVILRRTPPKPAIAADKAKAATFVLADRIPTVTAPDSVAHNALMARPVLDFMRFRTSRAARDRTMSRTTTMVRPSCRLNGPIDGGGTAQPALPLLMPLIW